MQHRHRLFQTLGDVANMGLFVTTSIVSYCMLYRYPKESLFDVTWLQYGFCVSHPNSALWNSHHLAFYSDCVMTLALAICYYFYYYYSSNNNSNNKSSKTTNQDLGQALLLGSIPSVFFHGMGHLYYGSMDPAGFDLRWNNTNRGISKNLMSNSVSFLAQAGIFKGTMALASYYRICFTALIGTIGVTLLNVPATLNFVYFQAFIYLASSAHMLSLDSQHKQSAAYLVYPLLQFPVLVIGVLESTHCQQMLSSWGGHLVFDTAISIGHLMAPMMTNYLESLVVVEPSGDTKKVV